MEQIVSDIKSNKMVNICTGYYYVLHTKLKGKAGIEVKMPTEIVWEAVKER